MNEQPIEKSEGEYAPDIGYDVHSIFPTIQGEGPFVGQPSTFVRFAGCNLQCPLCDTEYTKGRMRLTVPVIFDTIQDTLVSPEYVPLIVLTGGEPFRQDLKPLVQYLLFRKYRVQIETNGTLHCDLPWNNDDLTIVCSPKAGKINDHLLRVIDYYKYVVRAGDIHVSDGLPIHALDHPVAKMVARPPEHTLRKDVYVQPADEGDIQKNQANLKAAIQSCTRFGYTLCLQTHKMIGLP